MLRVAVVQPVTSGMVQAKPKSTVLLVADGMEHDTDEDAQLPIALEASAVFQSEHNSVVNAFSEVPDGRAALNGADSLTAGSVTL
jgi:hypothetical protein